jgi:hypothetical protein
MAHEVVFNGAYGGFGVTLAGLEWLRARGVDVPEADFKHARAWGGVSDVGLPRHHPLLAQMVRELGGMEDLAIRSLAGSRYRIEEHDGWETVQEPADLEWIDATVSN